MVRVKFLDLILYYFKLPYYGIRFTGRNVTAATFKRISVTLPNTLIPEAPGGPGAEENIILRPQLHDHHWPFSNFHHRVANTKSIKIKENIINEGEIV